MGHSEELQEMILLLQDLRIVDLDTETNAIDLPPTTDEDCIHELLTSRNKWQYHRVEVSKILREFFKSDPIIMRRQYNLRIARNYRLEIKHDNRKTAEERIKNMHKAKYATIIAKSSSLESEPIR